MVEKTQLIPLEIPSSLSMCEQAIHVFNTWDPSFLILEVGGLILGFYAIRYFFRRLEQHNVIRAFEKIKGFGR